MISSILSPNFFGSIQNALHLALVPGVTLAENRYFFLPVVAEHNKFVPVTNFEEGTNHNFSMVKFSKSNRKKQK
jgi:hypothetical protein